MNVTLKYDLSNDLNHKYFRQVFTDGVNKWDVGSFFFHTFFFQPDELHPAFSFSFFFYKNKCNNNAGLRHALAFRLTKLFKNSNSSSSFILFFFHLFGSFFFFGLYSTFQMAILPSRHAEPLRTYRSSAEQSVWMLSEWACSSFATVWLSMSTTNTWLLSWPLHWPPASLLPTQI